MAHTYLNITYAFYVGAPLPEIFMTRWGLPLEDEAGNALDYTVEAGLAAASLGSAAPFSVEHMEGAAPVRDSENPTHVIIPLNNVGGDVIQVLIGIAAAEGRSYEQVHLSHKQVRLYLATGELPA